MIYDYTQNDVIVIVLQSLLQICTYLLNYLQIIINVVLIEQQ